MQQLFSHTGPTTKDRKHILSLSESTFISYNEQGHHYSVTEKLQRQMCNIDNTRKESCTTRTSSEDTYNKQDREQHPTEALFLGMQAQEHVLCMCHLWTDIFGFFKVVCIQYLACVRIGAEDFSILPTAK